MSLEQLKKNRLDWVEANRKNRFEAGIKNLLTQLYPDNAHFIYELLQNSEDTRASIVRFILTNDNLDFEHNGKRLFSLADVESITGIGDSTKLDDPTSIGKFGVGFKAVFAYTNTPEIHSGEFHFRILDLVVPETNGVKKQRLGERETRFIFPFDHPKKLSAQAVEEVERGLRALGDNTLLFLNYIRKIEYLLPDDSLGSLERIDHEGGHIEIRSIHPGGNDTISHWLRFQKDVEVVDEDGKPKTCRVAIAYNLVKEEDKKKRRSPWKIVPLDHGQVSIYFPAEKETSNLRFHLHAPFASTVARDSVRDCKANHQLRDHLADLVVESLSSICDQGMLTVDFLSVLPNPVDNLAGNSPFYEPIRKAIVHAFKNELLTPTRSGAHSKANGLYRGPARIAEVLNDDDLSFLTNYDPPLWAANPPQQNQREDRFLDSLEIDEWGWSELVCAVSSLKNEERERIENWIAQKDDAWLIRFYALLGEACDTYHKTVYVSNVRIVRSEVDQDLQHVIPGEAFFPPDEEKTSPPDICFVKPTVYNTGRSEAQKKYASLFLKKIGVRPFDAKAIIQLRLEHYKSPPKQIEEGYYKELKQFIAYWKENTTEASLFSNHTFLVGVSLDGKLHWRKATELCLDSPYIETGLTGLAKIHGKYSLWDGYQDKFRESEHNDFMAFLKAIGAMHDLKVVRVYTYSNPKASELRKDFNRYGTRRSDYEIDEDYSISSIDKYLAMKSISASRLIWDALINADRKSAKARFRPNQQYQIRDAESQLVYHLKHHAWIPDKSENFRKPQDMTKDDLRSDFPYDERNGLLIAIGFGENVKKRSEEYKMRKEMASSLGLPVELADFLSTLSGEEREKESKELKAYVKRKEEARERAQQIQQEDIPYHEALGGFFLASGSSTSSDSVVRGGSARNPSLRRDRTSEDIAAAIENEGTPEARFSFALRKRWKGKNDQVRVALTEWYGGQCQICGKTFTQRSGEPYFEGLYLVPYTMAEWLDRVGNVLCLCAWHSAMFQFGSKEVEEDIIQQVTRLKARAEGGDGHPTIRMKLCGKQIEIVFAENHLIDLQEMIRASRAIKLLQN